MYISPLMYNELTQTTMTYGLPYKGSKNKIAEWVVAHLPKADTLYDLFCGGCAVTHCAMLQGKFKNYVINDIVEGLPQLFIEAINGRVKIEREWVSREEFFERKDKEPLIACVWSFGNNCKGYMYSKEIEPFKKALFYFVYKNDDSLLKEMGIEIPIDINLKESKKISLVDKWVRQGDKILKEKIAQYNIQCKQIELDRLGINYDALDNEIAEESERLRLYLVNGLNGIKQSEVCKRLGNQMAGHYFGRSQWGFPTEENYTKMQTFMNLPLSYERATERLFALQMIKGDKIQMGAFEIAGRLNRFRKFKKISKEATCVSDSYSQVAINGNGVIYCDIPYEDTSDYGKEFDFDSFYKWCKQQDNLVVVSEYDMPDDFVCVAEKDKTCAYSAVNNATKTTERLYVPKHQLELYNTMMNNTL